MGREAASVMAGLHRECFTREESWDTRSFAQLLSSPGVKGWVARDGMDLLGLLLVRFAVDECEVLTLCVHPSARLRGIGRMLMSNFLEISQARQSIIFLEVSIHNKVAQKLYSSLDFKNVGYRPRYYADGSDAIVLSFSEK